MQNPPGDVTQALLDVRAGGSVGADAAGRLWQAVYGELRRLAQRELRGGRGSETMTPTALVHEAYLKLVDAERVDVASRTHFFALSCRAMRQILVDHARARNRVRRGGGVAPLALEDALVAAEERAEDLVALDEALARLAEVEPRYARVVECRFFGGMSVEETAEALGTSPATVKRDWTMARAWLNRELGA